MIYEYSYYFPSDLSTSDNPQIVNSNIRGWWTRTDKNATFQFTIVDKNGNIGDSEELVSLLTKTEEGEEQSRVAISYEIYKITDPEHPETTSLGSSIKGPITGLRTNKITVLEEELGENLIYAIKITTRGSLEEEKEVTAEFLVYANKAKVESANFDSYEENGEELSSEGVVRIKATMESYPTFVKPIKAKIYASESPNEPEAELKKEITIADQSSREHMFSIFESDGITIGVPYYYWISIESPFGSQDELDPFPVQEETITRDTVIHYPITLKSVAGTEKPGVAEDGLFSSIALLSDGPNEEETRTTTMTYTRFTSYSDTYKLFDIPNSKGIIATIECDVFRGGDWGSETKQNYSVKYAVQAKWNDDTENIEPVWTLNGSVLESDIVKVEANISATDNYIYVTPQQNGLTETQYEDVFCKISIMETPEGTT